MVITSHKITALKLTLWMSEEQNFRFEGALLFNKFEPTVSESSLYLYKLKFLSFLNWWPIWGQKKPQVLTNFQPPRLKDSANAKSKIKKALFFFKNMFGKCFSFTLCLKKTSFMVLEMTFKKTPSLLLIPLQKNGKIPET